MKLLFQIIKKIWKSKRYVIITENDESIDIQYSDNDIDWKSSIINKLNSNFIEETTLSKTIDKSIVPCKMIVLDNAKSKLKQVLDLSSSVV